MPYTLVSFYTHSPAEKFSPRTRRGPRLLRGETGSYHSSTARLPTDPTHQAFYLSSSWLFRYYSPKRGKLTSRDAPPASKALARGGGISRFLGDNSIECESQPMPTHAAPVWSGPALNKLLQPNQGEVTREKCAACLIWKFEMNEGRWPRRN